MPRRARSSQKLGITSPGNRPPPPADEMLARVAACSRSILGRLEAEGRAKFTADRAVKILGRDGFTPAEVSMACARLCWIGALEPDAVHGLPGYRRPRLVPTGALAALREAQRAYLAATGWERQPTPAHENLVPPEARAELWCEETWAHPQLGAATLDRASTLQATLDTWAAFPVRPGALGRAADEVAKAAAGIARGAEGPAKAQRTP